MTLSRDVQLHNLKEVITDFDTVEEEFYYHVVRAEAHARAAHDLLYKENGPKRSFGLRVLLGRTQSSLMTLRVREGERRRT